MRQARIRWNFGMLGPVDDVSGGRLSYRRLLGIPDLPALLLAAGLARLAERMLVLTLVLYALVEISRTWL
jgi:hypothetical protein